MGYKEHAARKKVNFHNSIPLNLLWGSKYCSRNAMNVKKWGFFYYKTIHRILEIPMSREKEKSTKNETFRKSNSKHIKKVDYYLLVKYLG